MDKHNAAKYALSILAMLVLLAGTYYGSTQPSAMEKAMSDVPEGAQSATSQAMGMIDNVVVEVMFDDSTIYLVRVVEHSETDGIGTMAVADLPGAIVSEQSLAVDAVSGATITSEAIRTAVTQALTQAGVDVAQFQ